MSTELPDFGLDPQQVEAEAEDYQVWLERAMEHFELWRRRGDWVSYYREGAMWRCLLRWASREEWLE